jgi:hypothetical protein
MKYSRVGETLWSEWDGESHSDYETSSLIFYTHGHVDIHNDVVRRALASAIQRDGSVDSLGQAFQLLDGKCLSDQGYAGNVDGDPFPTVCDVDGLTILGETVEEASPVTFVRIYV